MCTNPGHKKSLKIGKKKKWSTSAALNQQRCPLWWCMATGYAEEAEAGGSGGGQLRLHLLGQPGGWQVKVLAMLTSTTTPQHMCTCTHTSQYDNDK